MSESSRMIRRLVGRIHLWVGLALCVPLVLLGLTGSLLVYQDELRAAFAPPTRVEESGQMRPAGEIIAAARAAVPSGFVAAGFTAPPRPGEPASVRFVPTARDATAEPVRVDVDPVSLAVVVDPPPDLLRRVFLLHANLMLPVREGRPIVGWLGVAMLAMGVSGVVNWWPRRAAWRAAFAVSHGARGVRLWRELHGMAGIWGLLVFLTVSFGGVYLAFPEAVRSIVAPVLPARDLRAASAGVKVTTVKGAEPLPPGEAITLAEAAIPGAQTAFVFLPTRPDQPYRVALRRAGDNPHETPVTVFVDPWRGQIVDTLDPRQFSAGETLLAAQHAMHAGQRFGPVWKFLVFLCGLLPALFAATGIAMWAKRRRRAAPTGVPLADQTYTVRRAGE